QRPARGFHRFRNGILNVTPKGGEKELVRRNQKSRLLRLPAEIRTRIWQFVLGGNVLRPNVYDSTKFVPQATNQKLGLNLLRTCRQIYAESALMPHTQNTFFITIYGGYKRFFKNFRTYQLAQIQVLITDVCHEVGFLLPPFDQLKESDTWSAHVRGQWPKLDFLPGLKRVHVLVF
ncbi:hypothetical protein EK21DRAFT_33876, partial [Setomelanomma holmii]